ncbi:MAG: helix-turn-helix transcriptional regulator [Clostridia bacterium]|nr:helix-turn-helix transcriptional regulator [Clostridia bacterium]
MKCYFNKCSEAVRQAAKAEGFGAFHSTKNNPNKDVHVHDCCEIFLCVKGGGHFLVDNKVYTVKEGVLFIINQFEAHKIVPDKNEVFSRYILHTHPSFLRSARFGDFSPASCFYSPNKATRVSLSDAECDRLVELFESLNLDYGCADEAYKRLRAEEIVLDACRFSLRESTRYGDGVMHESIDAAIGYINENFSHELSVEEVAKSVFLSPTQLSRLFKRYCGTTPMRYIIGKRITEAKKLLSEGKSVTEVAFMCGFNDYANFIRAFKSAVGIPPGKYRSSGR